MKTLKELLDGYATYHQNPTNIVIHIICVPLIFWSTLGFIWILPAPEFLSLFPRLWVKLCIILGLFFYWRLSQIVAVWMLSLSIGCLISFYFLHQYFVYSMSYLFATTFVLAWIGLLVGYKIEGKKPAFMQNMLFLLVGPIWVLKYMGLKTND